MWRNLCLTSLGLSLAVLLAGTPNTLDGQATTDFRLGVGTVSERLQPNGVYGIVGGTRFITPAFGLRGDTFLGVGDDRLTGSNLLVGADATFVFLHRGVRWTPYVAAGFGYTRTRSLTPLASDLGVSGLLGVETAMGSSRWFLELRPRFSGNIFYRRAPTRSLFFITVGRVW